MSAEPVAGGDRLAKVIARSGLCSRRDAESWIKAGRVSVNGGVIRTPAFNVSPRDKIEVDGAPLAVREATRVWLYHKPPGLVVTEKDPEGRPTIFEKLAEQGLPRVVTIGRLDINTEGLLLLTNDGGLKRVLELPATGWLRRYRVRAHGTVTQPALDALKNGVEIEGLQYGPIEATFERQQGSNVWLLVALREGKNREVKNVLASLGLQVNRLIRVSFGPFQLGDLPVGAIELVKSRVLRDQLGERLAKAAGADFQSEPAVVRPVRSRSGPGSAVADGDRGTSRGRAGAERTSPRGRTSSDNAEAPRGPRAGGAGAAGPRDDRPRGDRRSGGAAPDAPRRPRAQAPDRAGAPSPRGRGPGSDRPPRANVPRGGPRKIHYGDGREVVFEPKTYGRPARVEKPDDAGAARPPRGGSPRPPREGGKERQSDRPGRPPASARPRSGPPIGGTPTRPRPPRPPRPPRTRA